MRTLLAGLRVVVTDRNTAMAALLADGRLGTLVAGRDRIALTYGLLSAPHPDRATVLERLAPWIVRDAVTDSAPRAAAVGYAAIRPRPAAEA